MLEFLDGFGKRMEFFAIADSIVNRKNTSDKIEKLFKGNLMENLIVSVLVYIMETTLTEEEKCTIDNISNFVKKIIQNYNVKYTDYKELTRYIVKDILQNKGQNRYYEVMNYHLGKVEKIDIRLIFDKLDEDNQVVYELTKQGYDFLFRTKEVDDELGFQIEEIRLKMLIHKKNYKKAVSTSKELIKMLKNKQIEINQFESELRNNINSISGERYDTLVNAVYQTLTDEYKEMEEVEELVNESIKRLNEEEDLTGVLDEKSKNAKREIWLISNNIRTAKKMQLDLLSQCKKTRKLYIETLKESIQYSLVKTYNFEDKIIRNLEKTSFQASPEIYVNLLKPLLMPRLPKSLNLNLIYSNQSKIRGEEEEEYSIEQDIFEEQTLIKERIEKRNNAHIEVIRTLFDYGAKHNEFTLEEYLKFLKENKYLKDMLNEKLLFMQMLKLYSTDGIDLQEWRNEKIQNQTEANGEFDLSYCLQTLSENEENFHNIEKIKVTKMDEKIEYTYPEEEDIVEKIEITNLKFEVKINGESS